MGWDTGLADRIRRKGVRVVEVDGWRTRGSTTYTPTLALHHHTAGSRFGSVPSLAVCVYGRPGLPGPLCQVLQSREPDGRDDIAYVIAAGKANHAGVGVWRGVAGNSRAGGVEVEHTGTERVSPRRREITCRILAAILEGGSRDALNACQHFEYATPAGRKIDFHDLATDTPGSIRSRVAYWIGREEDDVDEATLRKVVKEELVALIDEIAAASGQKAHERINFGFEKAGSVIRKESRVLARLGAEDAVAPERPATDTEKAVPAGKLRAYLDERFDEVLAAVNPPEEPTDPSVPPAG